MLRVEQEKEDLLRMCERWGIPPENRARAAGVFGYHFLVEACECFAACHDAEMEGPFNLRYLFNEGMRNRDVAHRVLVRSSDVRREYEEEWERDEAWRRRQWEFPEATP
eukprot:11891017-Alexandrium_andersonii.AAC.1